MRIRIAVDSKDIKQLICNYVNQQLGEATMDVTDVKLYVKSRQNYRSDWEEADILVTNEVPEKLYKSDIPNEIKAEVG